MIKGKQLFQDVLSDLQLQKIEQTSFGKVKINSKLVRPGDVFVCLSGQKADGHDFAREAIKNGAKLVVCQKDLGLENQVIVEDSRAAFSLLCKNFYHRACDRLKIIAITGTNGKTTVSHLCGHVFEGLDKRAAVIGTLGAFYNGKRVDVGLTTPDPDKLHKTFFDMANEGIEYVFMEASAHAIALKKLEGIKFQSVLLTNITQDHLDFFGNMENYAKTKLTLFDKKYCKKGIVYDDQKYSKYIFESVLKSDIPIFTYGLKKTSDISGFFPMLSMDGSEFLVNSLGLFSVVKSKLVGDFNVQNLLACIAVCELEGLELEDVVCQIENLDPIPGRFNVTKVAGVSVVIDYAHTPDGLENLLKSVKKLSNGSLVTVFGCGGNRDKLKRPIMGRISSRLSDYTILTSDNPRYEDENEIIRDIEKGVKGRYEICVDRRKAIERGLEICKKGDTLVIAGKGAENWQEKNGKKVPFSDFEQVYNCARLRKHNCGEKND